MIGLVVRGLLMLGGALLTGAIIVKVHQKITASLIAKKIAEEKKEAFKAIIKEKKENAVDVGIYTQENAEIGVMTIETDMSVDKNLYKGQQIYATYI